MAQTTLLSVSTVALLSRRGAGMEGGFAACLLLLPRHRQRIRRRPGQQSSDRSRGSEQAQQHCMGSAPLVAIRTHETKPYMALNVGLPNLKQINIFHSRLPHRLLIHQFSGRETGLYDH